MRLKNIILVLVAVLTVSIVACNNKPTAVSDFSWEDETTDKRDDWQNKTNTANNSVVFVETIFESDTKALNPVVIANGNNVVVFYQKNHTFKAGMNPTTTADSLFYRGSVDGGTFFSVAIGLDRTLVDGGSLSSPMSSPHVFLDGNNLTIAAVYNNNEYIIYKTGIFSQKGKVGGIDEQNWNWTRPINKNAAYQTDWNNYRKANGINSISLVAGVGKANTLPVSYTDSKTSGIIPVSLPNFSFGVKIEGKTGKFGQNSKGVISDNIITEQQSDITTASSKGGYEVIYDGKSYTYAIYNDILYRASGDKIPTISDEKMTISGSTGGSVAVGSDGSIFTFTKDAKGLVFRKINKFENGKTIN
ncbi:hypothetical protein EPJ64_04765 [Brachyspira aalborgi]|uniref:hypothetical protein n=1 Tax=Brachyspira aalborgi TaxID=29522 RepID=UPI0011C7BF2F|nr:hypothetical protein [Brachyspira aalborgi]TXJ15942.1 hypothetical protein EPJ77_04785 [Brachyspira aalborgi]TXJ19443.1 hypothetical protein EPJ64_04765 [Brachyspira aalborgi]